MAGGRTRGARDSRGTRLVIGQNVHLKEHNRVGQLVGIVEPEGTCVVRLNGTGQVVSAAGRDLTVATWEQVRGDTGIRSRSDVLAHEETENVTRITTAESLAQEC